jgi:hypothetical protein
MKKLTVVLGLLIACTASAGTTSTSGIPTFTSASAGTNSSGWLITNFKETGLNRAEFEVTYKFSAYAVANYGCVARKKVTQLGQVAAPESVYVTVQIPSNSTITAGMAIEAPGPQAGWSCPSGSTLEVLNVSYSEVSLQDTTNGITPGLTGTCALNCTAVLVSSK